MHGDIEPRRAAIVLILSDGTLLGQLDPVNVETPWWQDVEPVVKAVRDRHGLEITILRMLEAEQSSPHGGLVTYLAEVQAPVDCRPWNGVLEDDVKRADYAKLGGPAKDLAWACASMASLGIQQAGKPVQIRSWNLSSLWRIPSDAGMLWLKVLPPFFAHEAALLETLSGHPTPQVLAQCAPRLLMAEVPGVDLHEADHRQHQKMIEMLVKLQATWQGRQDELLAQNLPDWRQEAATKAIRSIIKRLGPVMSAADRHVLEQFVEELDQRFSAIDACGLGPTLVHGDFHPGNVRGMESQLTLLDFADAAVGHPLLDMPAFLERVPKAAKADLHQSWCQAWRALAPNSEPERAATLIQPMASARQACIYQMFLDQIETAEHPYHRDDPLLWLGKTANKLRLERYVV